MKFAASQEGTPTRVTTTNDPFTSVPCIHRQTLCLCLAPSLNSMIQFGNLHYTELFSTSYRKSFETYQHHYLCYHAISCYSMLQQIKYLRRFWLKTLVFIHLKGISRRLHKLKACGISHSNCLVNQYNTTSMMYYLVLLVIEILAI